MKKLKLGISSLIISLIFITSTNAQDNLSGIAILPFNSNGIDEAYIQTSESILYVEINKLSRLDIISAKRTSDALADENCNESECAIEVGKNLNAEQVLGVRLSALGEKIITQIFFS